MTELFFKLVLLFKLHCFLVKTLHWCIFQAKFPVKSFLKFVSAQQYGLLLVMLSKPFSLYGQNFQHLWRHRQFVQKCGCFILYFYLNFFTICFKMLKHTLLNVSIYSVVFFKALFSLHFQRWTFFSSQFVQYNQDLCPG